MSTAPKLSIVATLYMSEPYLEEFYSRCTAAARKLVGNDYEIVLVNDGSPDNSRNKARALVEADQHVSLIDLSRNFGHHKAIMTGLSYAQGELVFLIDSDLEEPPEALLDFAHEMRVTDCDVVYGVQSTRKGDLSERVSGAVFWRLINFMSGMNIPANPLTARLMTRAYVQALVSHTEREVFLAGLWHITGFEQRPIVVQKKSREETTYSLRKRMALFVNSITAFSNLPLIWIFYCGTAIMLFALVYILYLFINRLFFAGVIEGWTSVVASVWLLGGLMISFMGITGAYISKIYSEVKNRPYTIVRKVYRHEQR